MVLNLTADELDRTAGQGIGDDVGRHRRHEGHRGRGDDSWNRHRDDGLEEDLDWGGAKVGSRLNLALIEFEHRVIEREDGKWEVVIDHADDGADPWMHGRIEAEEDEKLLCGNGPDDEVDPHREKEEIDKNSVLVELRIRKDIGDRIGNEDADDGRKGRNA